MDTRTEEGFVEKWGKKYSTGEWREMLTDLAALIQAEREKAVDMLKDIQWCITSKHGDDGYVHTCPICCGWEKGKGHKQSCRLATAIRGGA